MSVKYSKTKTSLFRRLYVAYLIEQGYANVPDIVGATGMPRRTAQDTIAALNELEIQVEFVGARKSGNYRITDWGTINKEWIENNVQRIIDVLEYPAIKGLR